MKKGNGLKTIRRSGRQFVERRMGPSRTDLLEVRRRRASGGDEFLNYAAIAVYRGLDVNLVYRNQRIGWPGNDGKPLPVHRFDVETASGKKCRVPFVLRSVLDAAIPKRRSTSDESNERFRWEGEWVRAKWSLFEPFHVARGRPAHRIFKRYDLVFRRVVSPRTGRWVEIVREADLLDALKQHETDRARAPLLDDRSTIWLSDFAARVFNARNGTDPPAGWDSDSAAQQICRVWMRRSCRHLGRKLRAGREKQVPQRIYVDAEDAREILRSVEAERRGELPPGRDGLTAAEICRKLGVTLKRLNRWAADGLITAIETAHPTHGGMKDGRPQKLYRLDEVAAVAKGGWQTSEGYFTERQLAERLGADTLAKRLYLRNLLVDGVRVGEIRREKDPRKRKGWHYCFTDVEACFDRLAENLLGGHSRAGWKKESARNDRWLSWRENGLTYGQIRDKQIAEHPDEPIEKGRKGLDAAKVGIKSARKRRDRSAKH